MAMLHTSRVCADADEDGIDGVVEIREAADATRESPNRPAGDADRSGFGNPIEEDNDSEEADNAGGDRHPNAVAQAHAVAKATCEPCQGHDSKHDDCGDKGAERFRVVLLLRAFRQLSGALLRGLVALLAFAHGVGFARIDLALLEIREASRIPDARDEGDDDEGEQCDQRKDLWGAVCRFEDVEVIGSVSQRDDGGNGKHEQRGQGHGELWAKAHVVAGVERQEQDRQDEERGRGGEPCDGVGRHQDSADEEMPDEYACQHKADAAGANRQEPIPGTRQPVGGGRFPALFRNSVGKPDSRTTRKPLSHIRPPASFIVVLGLH